MSKTVSYLLHRVGRVVDMSLTKQQPKSMLRGTLDTHYHRWRASQKAEAQEKAVSGWTLQTPTASTWREMIGRCYLKPKGIGWKHYGGRGIQVCRRWFRFENFLADMGERPSGMTLDRKDVDDDYYQGNCRWATAKQQGHNQRRRRHGARKSQT